ncbi:N-acetylmannosamine-6-phosphate 2-epimerase [Microlunatus parietis]|uniref:N-acylglucosamine-6-phosphate 2-epimerase n=1 Tax=Microlunatus parietis TaxID=682979 RepID=A0A7Y9I361_9ACTN|nr:putative N-acetylmannosamine-6-phosphate 2-epimerase [Microlunatus parietis]NYE69395.1 putative N-acetylmannosamine-6-phosphate epimerase [Microlunatus parietis]
MTATFTEQIPQHGLIVSCQATTGSPLRESMIMALMAESAELGGAAGLRANGTADVAMISSRVDLPLIGINKLGDPAGVFITPSVQAALEIVDAGATIIALDGTQRPRPDGSSLADQLAMIKAETQVPIMADVDTVEAGMAARRAGADVVATTLSGYTGTGDGGPGPDLGLVTALAAAVDCPVIAEGRIRDESEALAALAAGAYAVVVGSAITNPVLTTRRFVDRLGTFAS